MQVTINLCGRVYSVSEDGNVYRPNGKPLSKHRRKDYEYIEIANGEKRKKVSVHRIVATAFLPNPLNLPQVNHIDGDTTNNHVENLEWVSGSENQYHSRYVLGNQTGFADTPVVCIETGEKYISTRDAWRKTGISYCHISEAARGKRKSAGGYHWEVVK